LAVSHVEKNLPRILIYNLCLSLNSRVAVGVAKKSESYSTNKKNKLLENEWVLNLKSEQKLRITASVHFMEIVELSEYFLSVVTISTLLSISTINFSN
jgi:hypothetical protein